MHNLFTWLHEMELDSLVSSYKDHGGIVIVIVPAFTDSYMVTRFNRWNESNGIEYSLARLKEGVFIIYPKNNNGVQISDLA